MKFYSYGRTDITPFTISQAEIDAAMRRARAERAEVVRAAFASLTAAFKAVVARIRTSRRLPKAGAWA
jgi:hypothetical protein